MAESSLPSIEDRCVCIATGAGLALAATISSYFNEPDTYFAVFEFPTLDYPYTGASESESDGFYARVLGEKSPERSITVWPVFSRTLSFCWGFLK